MTWMLASDWLNTEECSGGVSRLGHHTTTVKIEQIFRDQKHCIQKGIIFTEYNEYSITYNHLIIIDNKLETRNTKANTNKVTKEGRPKVDGLKGLRNM